MPFFRMFLCWLLTGLLLPLLLAGCGVSTRMGELPTAAECEHYAQFANFRDGHFFNREEGIFLHRRFRGSWLSPDTFRLFFRSENAPPVELPMVKLNRSDFTAEPTEFSVVWLGHSSLLFELSGRRFLVDPVFGNASPVPGTMKRYTAPPLSHDELPEVNFVLISHDHYDHLEYDSIRAWRNKTMKFVVPLGVGCRLRGWGIEPWRIYELNWNDTVVVDGISITAQTARHFSGRSLEDRNQTLWVSYVIEAENRKIFFGGDGGYGAHFKEIGERFGPFDLVALEIDAWNEFWPHNHSFPSETVKAAQDLQGRLLLPIHWGVFDLARHPWQESIEKVAILADYFNVRLLTPLPGQRVVPGLTPTSRWWRDCR